MKPAAMLDLTYMQIVVVKFNSHSYYRPALTSVVTSVHTTASSTTAEHYCQHWSKLYDAVLAKSQTTALWHQYKHAAWQQQCDGYLGCIAVGTYTGLFAAVGLLISDTSSSSIWGGLLCVSKFAIASGMLKGWGWFDMIWPPSHTLPGVNALCDKRWKNA